MDRGSRSTTRQSYDGVSALAPNRPEHAWQFANDVQGLLGDDAEPDPLFFVESWTLGVPVAVENCQQRRLRHADREPLRSGCREPDGIGSSHFVQNDALYAELLSSAYAAADAGRSHASWPQLTADPAKTQDDAPQDWSTYAEGYERGRDIIHPMTQRRACQILGVATTSTLKQIKDAYRQKVSRWHPDRLESRTNDVRQRATEQTAAINEAYRLLRVKSATAKGG